MVDEALGPDHRLFTIPYHPRFGATNSIFSDKPEHAVINTETSFSEINPMTKNDTISDYLIINTPMWMSAACNLYEMTKGVPALEFPVWKDDHTTVKNVKFDSVTWAAGSSLQGTFECQNVAQSTRLFDNWIPLCSIITPLSAATPVVKGLLLNTDQRYNFLKSLDIRSLEERDPSSTKFKPKNLFGTCNNYI